MVSACLRLTPWGFFLAAAAPDKAPAGVAGIGVVGVLGMVVAGAARVGVGVAGVSASAVCSLVLEVIDMERTGLVAFLALEAAAEGGLAGV